MVGEERCREIIVVNVITRNSVQDAGLLGNSEREEKGGGGNPA